MRDSVLAWDSKWKKRLAKRSLAKRSLAITWSSRARAAIHAIAEYTSNETTLLRHTLRAGAVSAVNSRSFTDYEEEEVNRPRRGRERRREGDPDRNEIGEGLGKGERKEGLRASERVRPSKKGERKNTRGFTLMYRPRWTRKRKDWGKERGWNGKEGGGTGTEGKKYL